ncbi:hypothetical protein ABPG74_016261 [Tetrahymena malaccensis]
MAGTCLKTILVICALITIAGGGLGLYFTLTQLNGYKELWSQVNQDVNKYAMYSLCGFTGVTILTGLISLVGVLKRNRCLLFIFNFLAVILLGLFVAIGVLITIYSNNQFQDIKNISNCNNAPSDYNWLQQSNEFYQKVGTLFCTQLCKCYVQNVQDFPASTFNNKSVATNPNDGTTQIQECPYAKQETQYDQYLSLVQFLENKFECSGICDPVPYYVFTDINRGPPVYTQGCKQRVQDFFEKYGNIVRVVSFSIGGFFFLQIILAIWLCCIRKSDGQNDYYSRMTQY